MTEKITPTINETLKLLYNSLKKQYKKRDKISKTITNFENSINDYERFLEKKDKK